MRNFVSFAALALGGIWLAGCGGDDACTSAAFPSAPSGAKGSLYVASACPSTGADGTQDHPFSTISEAIAKSKDGAAILVAAGTYPENLAIDHDLSIVGPSTKGKKGDDAGIILQAPSPDAIVATHGAATLVGFDVTGAAGVGVFAKGGSVTFAESKVEHTKTANATAYGVAALDDGAIILQDSAIVDSGLLGALIHGASGSFVESDVSHNQSGGIQLELTTNDVNIENCTLTGNTAFGVAVFSSGAIILQNQIRGTTADSNGAYGDGIVAGSLSGSSVVSSVSARGNTIAENNRVGILMSGGAHGIILQDNQVTGNASGTGFGGGIWLQGGAGGDDANTISGNHVLDNKFLGIGLVDETFGIKIDGNIVTGTKLGDFFDGASDHHIGDALSMFSSSSARVTSNHFSSSGRFGVVLDGEKGGAATTIENNQIEDNDKYGIILQNQGAQPNVGVNTTTGNKAGARKDIPTGGTTADVVDSAFATP